MSSSLKKNPTPRSSSETSSQSQMMSLPMPASTMFLTVSVATPRKFATKIVAFLILPLVYKSASFVSHHAKARPKATGRKEDGPLLGFQSPQTNLAVVQGCLILSERLSRRTISIMPMSRPSVISTTGAEFEPGSSNDITVRCRMLTVCHSA
jgi:hypothetical protein